MEDKSVKEMLDRFLQSNPDIKREDVETWHFGNEEKMAKELGKLVLAGKKTATSSDYSMYENENELPKVNTYHLITDFFGKAICVIRTKDVEIIPFNEMDKRHAEKEGEGDLSFEYWHKVHVDFFQKEREQVGMEFEEDMLVVFETFEVVFK